VKKFVVAFRDNDSTEHITVAAKIFGGGMENEIGAGFERPLNNGCPGIIAHANRPASCVISAIAARSTILEAGSTAFPSTRVLYLSQRFFHRRQIAHVGEVRFQLPAQKQIAQQSARTVIGIDVGENMIAGCECAEQTHYRRHPLPKAAAAERLQARSLLPPALCDSVIVARVHEPAGIRSLDIALECVER